MSPLIHPYFWLLMVNTLTCIAIGTSPNSFDSSPSVHDLLTNLQKTLISDTDVSLVDKAVGIITNLHDSSSCSRIAFDKLIRSCNQLSLRVNSDDNSQKPSSPEITLETLHDEFAVRLAICELTSAGVNVPHTCSKLDMRHTCKEDSLISRLIGNKPPHKCANSSSDGLKSCQESLHQTPQSWTSYSNARQNVGIVCQSARISLDKDNLLDTYRALTENSHSVNSRLFDAVAAIAKFEGAIHRMRREMNTQMEKDRLNHREWFDNFLKSCSTSLESLFGRTIEVNTLLEKNLNSAKKTQNLLKIISAKASEAQNELSSNVESASKLQNSLTTMEDMTSQIIKMSTMIAESLHIILDNFTLSVNASVENMKHSAAQVLEKHEQIEKTYGGFLSKADSINCLLNRASRIFSTIWLIAIYGVPLTLLLPILISWRNSKFILCGLASLFTMTFLSFDLSLNNSNLLRALFMVFSRGLFRGVQVL